MLDIEACKLVNTLIEQMFIDGKKVCVGLDLLWSQTQSEKLFGDPCKLQQQVYHRWCQAFCSKGQHNDGDPTGKRTLVLRNLSSNDQSPDNSFGPNSKSRPRQKSALAKSANFLKGGLQSPAPCNKKKAEISPNPHSLSALCNKKRAESSQNPPLDGWWVVGWVVWLVHCTIFLCSLDVGNIVQGGDPLYASVNHEMGCGRNS